MQPTNTTNIGITFSDSENSSHGSHVDTKLGASINRSEIQSSLETKLPKDKNSEFRGKHIAQRQVNGWNYGYGDPDDWDRLFEKHVIIGLEQLHDSEVTCGKELVKYCSIARYCIAQERMNKDSYDFGEKREDNSYTQLLKNNKYGYALERAVTIKYSDSFSLACAKHTGRFIRNSDEYREFFRYGLVLGNIKGKSIPLTQYIYSRFFSSKFTRTYFGYELDNYINTTRESALWLHSNPKLIPHVMEHIYQLINEALEGKLLNIPKIHWWYVHLAPDRRGSGGIAEMITKILCRFHKIDLPPWKEGIAPSIEVLLMPSEEEFCENYHTLFEYNNEMLKSLFEG